ncbi:MAG: peptide deformylase [Bacteroidota bacterium]
MARNFSICLTILTAMFFSACSSNDPSLTLEIPEEGLEVVQQIPVDSVGREQNALYLAPREIKKEEFNTPALQTYIDYMYDIMLKKAGVGIASNQLGKRLQIFMIEAKASNPRYKVLGPVQKQIFINPVITKASKNRKNFWHGCLSAHGANRGNVATYEWIEYSCLNEKGEVREGRLDGFAAVIFQHEFRHMLNGTYLDHANHFLPKAELEKKIEEGELPFFDNAHDTLPLLIEKYTIGETLNEYHARKS